MKLWKFLVITFFTLSSTVPSLGATFENLGQFSIIVPRHDNGGSFFAAPCENRRRGFFFVEDKTGFYQLADKKNPIFAGEKFTAFGLKNLNRADHIKFKETLESQNARFFALDYSNAKLPNLPWPERNQKEVLWKNSEGDPGVPLGIGFFNWGTDWAIYSSLESVDLSEVDRVMIFVDDI